LPGGHPEHADGDGELEVVAGSCESQCRCLGVTETQPASERERAAEYDGEVDDERCRSRFSLSCSRGRRHPDWRDGFGSCWPSEVWGTPVRWALPTTGPDRWALRVTPVRFVNGLDEPDVLAQGRARVEAAGGVFVEGRRFRPEKGSGEASGGSRRVWREVSGPFIARLGDQLTSGFVGGGLAR